MYSQLWTYFCPTLYLLTRECIFSFGIALIGRMFLHMWFTVKLYLTLARCNRFLFELILLYIVLSKLPPPRSPREAMSKNAVQNRGNSNMLLVTFSNNCWNLQHRKKTLLVRLDGGPLRYIKFIFLASLWSLYQTLCHFPQPTQYQLGLLFQLVIWVFRCVSDIWNMTLNLEDGSLLKCCGFEGQRKF